MREQLLKEAEDRYRSLFEASPNPILLIKMNGEIFDCNLPAVKLSGLIKEKMVGKNMMDLSPIPKESIPIIIKDLKSIRKGEIIKPKKIQLNSKDGELGWVLYQISIIKINNEDLIQLIIQDEKLLEETIHDLSVSEDKFKDVIENLMEGYFENDLTGRYTYVNDYFCKMLEIKREDIIGKRYKGLYTDEVEDELTDIYRKIYNKEIPLPYLYETSPTLEGTWHEGLSDLKYDSKGNKIGFYGLIRDITKRKNAEIKLQESEKKLIEQNKELEKLNNLKSEFLKRASHELKTPLMVIKGFTNLLIELYKDEQDTQKDSILASINHGCDRLENIIGNIIESTKLESSEIRMNTSLEDLSFLIKSSLDELRSLAEIRNHTIDLKIDENIITQINKENIQEVLSNLIGNAIKYTPKRGYITIQAKQENNNVIVSIKDSGIGFTEEEKSRVFQQFGKIERDGHGLDLEIDGTGLGLHISKKIIELHDGKIWMDSEGRNKGSTFYFSLPLCINLGSIIF